MSVEGLESLRDIHGPLDPSVWPPAVGWWFVILIAVLLGIFSPRLTRAYKRKAERRRFVKRAAMLREAFSTAPADAVTGVSTLVRDVAVTRFPDQRVAGITGDAWLEFLSETSDGDDFTEGPGARLLDAPYRAPRDQHLHARASVFDIAERWVLHNA